MSAFRCGAADEFGSLIGEFNHMVTELRDKEKLRQAFGLHVGRKAAEQIMARDPGLGGTEQVITVMFVDIRGFTARASGADPRHIVQTLNDFLRAMVHVVEEHHSGMINKFLGDGFMALFGAGLPSAAHADEALQAAVAMLACLEELNIDLAARGESALAIGIGLHTGPAIVGSIGSPERLEFTAIGSTVNLASRIESLTKAVGETVVLSDATKTSLCREFRFKRSPRNGERRRGTRLRLGIGIERLIVRFDHRASFEARVLLEERQGHVAGGAVALFGDDEGRLALSLLPVLVVLGVVFFAHEQAHHVGVLLDAAGFAQIA